MVQIAKPSLLGSVSTSLGRAGLSRWAKVQWAKLRGDARVTNLQHDGVVVDLPEGIDPVAATAGLSAASTAMLGYDHPVEEKPIGEEVADTESEASADEG